MKNMLILFFTVLLSAMAFAGDIDLTLQENWTIEAVPEKVVPGFTKDADGTLNITTKGIWIYLSAPAVNFEKGKMYQFEGTIESNAKVQALLHFYDAADKEIHSEQFNCVPETDTELVEATYGNETVLKVKDASKWNVGESIALDTKPDFSDIPTPFIYSFKSGIKEINKLEDCYEVVLKAPIGKRCDVGMGLRQTHNIGYKQMLCNRYSLPVAPITLDYMLKDEMLLSSVEQGKWWPSAKTARFKIVQEGEGELQLRVKDFIIKEVNADW